MLNGILSSGPGKSFRDGILGVARPAARPPRGGLARGRAAVYNSGTLGEYITPTSGLGGCSSCSGTSGLGRSLGFDMNFSSDMLIGAAVGAAAIYLFLTQGK